MATLSTHNGNRSILTTFGEVMDRGGWHHPDDWGMLESQEWDREDVIRFVEMEDGWRAQRQADDGEWYVFLDGPQDIEGIEPEDIYISYKVGNQTEGYLNCGRLSHDDCLRIYSRWLQDALDKAFPDYTVLVGYYPPQRTSYSDEVRIEGVESEEQEEKIRERIQSVLDSFEYQGFEVEVPTVEELRAAPYFYELPQQVIQQVVAGEDPFDPDESNRKILDVVARYRPDEPLSDIAQIYKRIAEAGGALDYLWEVEMLSSSIGAGRVHEPLARAVLEGLDPRSIYEAWKLVHALNEQRKELRKTRAAHHSEMLFLRNKLKATEAMIAEDDRQIAQNTEAITKAVDVHRKQQSPQWDAYRTLVAKARVAQRERDYRRICATFDALLEAGDPNVRASNSGSPVFIAADGSTVAPSGMGLGAGAEKCPVEWYLEQFQERGITLVEG